VCTEEVLIESFEEGTPIGSWLQKNETKEILRRRVGSLCIHAFLQMLFKDHFIHADLHPGNILVRERRLASSRSSSAPKRSHATRVEEEGGGEGRSTLDALEEDEETGIDLIILDCGLVTALEGSDRRNFRDVFKAVAMRDGHLAGRLIIERSPQEQCRDREAYCAEVADLVNTFMRGGLRLENVKVGSVLTRMLSLSCKHRVQLDSCFASVVIAVVILEGLARRLDPSLDLIDAALPYLVRDSIRGR